MKFNAIALAVSLASMGAAHAATTNSDLTTKDGSGDVVLQIFDGDSKTFLWDLRASNTDDLQSKQFYAAVNPIGSLDLSNASLSTFLSNTLADTGSLDNIQWRVVGLSQIGPVNALSVSPNFGALLTSSVAPTVAGESAASLSTNLVNVVRPMIDAVALDNDGALGGAGNNADTKTVTSGNAQLSKLDSSQEGTQNVMLGLGTIDFYYIHRNPAAGLDQFASLPNGILASKLGAWTLSFDNDVAALTYGPPTAVPVPAAAWMLASGLLGLVRARRRV